jgi:hypothetical protein
MAANVRFKSASSAGPLGTAREAKWFLPLSSIKEIGLGIPNLGRDENGG